jgi:hypothetical protein
MDPLVQFLLPAITFFLTPVFGFWLSKKGKPYNGILFNLHKLSALAFVVLAAIRMYEFANSAQAETFFILMLLTAGLAVTALFISGALMSAGKSNPAVLLSLHRIAMAVLVIAMVGMFYIFESA